jgi:lipocalin-like protein
MRLLSLVLAAAALSVPAFSMQARAQGASELTGTWAWVSVETTRADGSKVQPFGPNPKGHVVFDSSGHFAYLLTRSGRAKFAGATREDGSADENKATVQGTLGMSGAYTVVGNTLSFKVEASTYPNSEGTEQKRTIVSLTTDELRYSNPAPTNAGGGTAVVVARRVK